MDSREEVRFGPSSSGGGALGRRSLQEHHSCCGQGAAGRCGQQEVGQLQCRGAVVRGITKKAFKMPTKVSPENEPDTASQRPQCERGDTCSCHRTEAWGRFGGASPQPYLAESREKSRDPLPPTQYPSLGSAGEVPPAHETGALMSSQDRTEGCFLPETPGKAKDLPRISCRG